MVVEAQADPKSGYLDRIQVVKGWLDDEGHTGTRLRCGMGRRQPIAIRWNADPHR